MAGTANHHQAGLARALSTRAPRPSLVRSPLGEQPFVVSSRRGPLLSPGVLGAIAGVATAIGTVAMWVWLYALTSAPVQP